MRFCLRKRWRCATVPLACAHHGVQIASGTGQHARGPEKDTVRDRKAPCKQQKLEMGRQRTLHLIPIRLAAGSLLRALPETRQGPLHEIEGRIGHRPPCPHSRTPAGGFRKGFREGFRKEIVSSTRKLQWHEYSGIKRSVGRERSTEAASQRLSCWIPHEEANATTQLATTQ